MSRGLAGARHGNVRRVRGASHAHHPIEQAEAADRGRGEADADGCIRAGKCGPVVEAGSSTARMTPRARAIASSPMHGPCSAATVWSSVGCSRVNPTHPLGVIFSWLTAGSRLGERSAAAICGGDFGRAIRDARCRRSAPRHPPDGAQRIIGGDQRGRPAQPHRHRHTG